MTCLHLVRHGETDWNVQGRWQGQADVALNARGLAQARQSAEMLAHLPLEAIYSSDLVRAAETARTIARANPAPLVLEPRLREIHQGEWQGQLVKEIKAHHLDAYQRGSQDPLKIAAPGGETTQQVRERALAAVSGLLDRYPRGNVVVVSHGFTLAVLITHFKKISFDRVWEQIPQNGEIIRLEIDRVQVDPG